MIGDLLQRVNDHERIKLFLTNSTLATLFSFFSKSIEEILAAAFQAAAYTKINCRYSLSTIIPGNLAF